MLNSGKLVSFEKTLYTRESLIYKNDLLVIIHNEKFPDDKNSINASETWTD